MHRFSGTEELAYPFPGLRHESVYVCVRAVVYKNTRKKIPSFHDTVERRGLGGWVVGLDGYFTFEGSVSF